MPIVRLRILTCGVLIALLGYYALSPMKQHDFEFRNNSTTEIWVETVSGFERDIACGILVPGNSSSSYFGIPLTVPPKTELTYWNAKLPEKNRVVQNAVLDLSAVERGHPNCILVFEFRSNMQWIARFESKD